MYGKRAIKVVMKEINSLKNNLNSINLEKEKWFKLKEDLKKSISDLIRKIKGVKVKKDKSNEEIHKFRKERDDRNKKVKELILKVKELNKQKKELYKKHGIKDDPVRIKNQIESLEMKIETEVLSFKKEQKLMDEIKRLKKGLQGTNVVAEISEKIKNVSKKIDEERKKANEAHSNLKVLLKKNKKEFKEFLRTSKEIEAIKKKQEAAFNKFIDYKKKFDQINQRLKDKLNSASNVKRVEGEKKKKHEFIKQEKEQRIIDEKVKVVEEKLKKTRKLTTEDLIALQGKRE